MSDSSVSRLPLVCASPLSEYYRHFSHTVIKKRDNRLLEMSDIFAWEWAKHIERVDDGLGMRPSLMDILDPDRDGFSSPIDFASETRRAVHLTGMPLERYYDQVKKLILS